MLLPLHIDSETVDARQGRSPVAIASLLLAMLAVHLALATLLDEQGRADLFYRFGVVAWDPRPWAWLTHLFLHAGWLHLLANGVFLWVYGAPLERRLGAWRLLLLFAAGAGASLVVHLATLPPFYADVPTVGASGAVSAVLGAFLVLLPAARLQCLLFTMVSFRPLVLRLPACVVLGLWFVGQLLYSLKLVGDVEDVAFWAHAGGFAAGALVAACLARRETQAERSAGQARQAGLASVWNALAAGDGPGTAAALAALPPPGPDDPPGRDLLETLAATPATQGATAEADAARTQLLRAFGRARDRFADAAAVSLYLHARHCFPPERLPAPFHREAGHAALSVRQPALAADAFRRALAAGLDDGTKRLLDTLATVLERRLGLPAVATRVRAARSRDPRSPA